jgi:hypothetical protein
MQCQACTVQCVLHSVITISAVRTGTSGVCTAVAAAVATIAVDTGCAVVRGTATVLMLRMLALDIKSVQHSTNYTASVHASKQCAAPTLHAWKRDSSSARGAILATPMSSGAGFMASLSVATLAIGVKLLIALVNTPR